ncbi:MAG TPA: pantoate--beta-alanine ligase [Mycobacteriales bacterium]|jgi:pantoate--beta-alanine ligase|nr:pantoate--beta-alanine ligase [Mycobacteriales bacterium]
MTPVVAHTRADLTAARDALSGRVAVVMTMGALHDGHGHLMEVAREHGDSVIVTIFVNPKQFGAGEDLERYPRTLVADLAICAQRGVDLVFAPSADEVYPADEAVPVVLAGDLGERLEGAHRPGHFDGVVTVVSRLLDLTRPDVAVFGEKDAQQLAVIRRMVAEQGREVEIVGVPTVRERDGLAMSSRNRYLSDAEREIAVVIPRALELADQHAAEGAAAAVAAAQAELEKVPELSVDYVALVDTTTWAEPTARTRFGKILVAARVGSTRLIDNRDVRLGTPSGLKD